ncbi:hypothetical protein Hanom_Chr02g00096171 [Helianthus anomalus]
MRMKIVISFFLWEGGWERDHIIPAGRVVGTDSCPSPSREDPSDMYSWYDVEI